MLPSTSTYTPNLKVHPQYIADFTPIKDTRIAQERKGKNNYVGSENTLCIN